MVAELAGPGWAVEFVVGGADPAPDGGGGDVVFAGFVVDAVAVMVGVVAFEDAGDREAAPTVAGELALGEG